MEGDRKQTPKNIRKIVKTKTLNQRIGWTKYVTCIYGDFTELIVAVQNVTVCET